MKRFYLLVLSCLALTAVPAQERVPRPVASGVNYSGAVRVPAFPVGARPRVADSRARAAELRGRTAPQRAKALSVVLDTTLCTAYTRAVDGETETSTTVTYDRYGLRQLVRKEGGGRTRQERYTYEVNADAFWTKRTIETDYCPNGAEPVEGRHGM